MNQLDRLLEVSGRPSPEDMAAIKCVIRYSPLCWFPSRPSSPRLSPPLPLQVPLRCNDARSSSPQQAADHGGALPNRFP
jgi:hypothetical protein